MKNYSTDHEYVANGAISELASIYAVPSAFFNMRTPTPSTITLNTL